ncbi:single-stranded-DNA-specific exonuclease RecJ [Oleiphilus sp. HI0068]|nr:single-stranded-DNA-specific exonuclease RecJ [Oleiphilus sp. HI0043]KZY43291.1 single-stranded-DNA-specific exonuclease RecJ [Oleiphilus sp. HI0050]KZY63260.1 single-stranded-DNA-specific exonuclease RecJ [Oleiphilus sp. HI0061]KZY73352.1 single-stranded-DNA-specific exonuclease RecJ [Oleiphilus sp. HI0068]KZY81178.1 single-stranded-DNA-specific exonuclease RecJ [Oleiphilus sp. HI0069]KZZ31806.1 single-stranded-DNA-specific exonuclease RecJ [Oleiphilus sp. HI0086]KZZ32543.1 single-strande
MKIVRRTLSEGAPVMDGFSPLLSRIYQARGVHSAKELSYQLADLESSSSLKGLNEALEVLYNALVAQQHILILGDFDCDGATSTALAVLVLREMGAKECSYIVPNRFEFGYGLTPEIVDYAAKLKPDLIVTVDNGIASEAGVERAKSLGIKVLVTDHHLPGDTLPKADAIVNPNQLGCEFPSKNAAGVGVIFYVLSSLRTLLKKRQWFEQRQLKEPNMASYLDLVALGTVADLVALDHNNRVLVSQGLKRIRAGYCRPGIKALLSLAGKELSGVKSSDMGFIVGPRLNAAGRLDDMSQGIECLLADSEVRAMSIAQRLDQLNVERKRIEAEMKQDAEAQVQSILDKSTESLALENLSWGLSLYEPHWHQGVIGILASRIKELFHRPVIAFAPASDDPLIQNRELKGSARSIPGLHMRDALDLVSKRHPELIKKFGGHAMAAGLSIDEASYPHFNEAFDQVVRELLREEDMESVILTDGPLNEYESTVQQIRELEAAGPWGQRFPEPCFENTFELVQSRVLKEKHLKLVLKMEGGHELFDAIQFNSPWVSQHLPEMARVVFKPGINEFRGRVSVQYIIEYLEPVS